MRYRYRIEPTPAQQRMLARVFGCARVVFNDALRVRDQAYRAGVKLSDAQIQRRVITAAKTTVERGWLTEVPSVALVQSVNDSRRAWRNFFDSRTGKRKGRRVGRPRMKSKKDHRQSFRLTRNGFGLRPNGRLFVAKVGQVRVRWSRALPCEPSSVTIIGEPDGHYYASFVVDVEPTPLPQVAREAGVDVDIVRLATIAGSDGRRSDVENPKHLGRKLRKLRRLEREKSRRQKGSNNRDKTRRKVAIAHGKAARARRDLHHNQAWRWCAITKCSTSRTSTSWGWSRIVGSHKRSRMQVGASSCGSLSRKPTATGALFIGCRVGWRRARPVRRVGIASANCLYQSVPGPARLAGRCTIATTMPPRSFSPPGGRRH